MTILLGTSKLRTELLGFLFSHTGESFYLRELGSILNKEPGNLCRELKKCEEEGLVTSKKRGNQKYFTVNVKYPLFADLKNIVAKTFGIESQLKEVVVKHDGIILAILYGSFAKGAENANSDIDLLIVGDFVESEFVSDLNKIEQKLKREINYISFSALEFKKKRKEKDGFLPLVLKEKHIILKGEI